MNYKKIPSYALFLLVQDSKLSDVASLISSNISDSQINKFTSKVKELKIVAKECEIVWNDSIGEKGSDFLISYEKLLFALFMNACEIEAFKQRERTQNNGEIDRDVLEDFVRDCAGLYELSEEFCKVECAYNKLTNENVLKYMKETLLK